MSGITVFGIPPHFVLSLAGGSHNSRHKGIRLSGCRLLLVLIRLSVPRVPTLPPYHPTLSDYLRMRSLYLGNTMSSSSANPNPFARFALAATETGIRRGAASSLAPARPVESSPAKKIRTALDGKPRDRPEPPKGLQEKYRYERALVFVLYVTIIQRAGLSWPNLSGFSATIVEVHESGRLLPRALLQQYHPPSARERNVSQCSMPSAPTG